MSPSERLPRLAATPLTCAHPGGIGAVVVWGVEAGACMRRLFPRLAREPVVFARPADERGLPIDEVVALRIPPEHALTGGEELELDFHGGRVAHARMSAFLAAQGAEEMPVAAYAACASSLDAAGREALAALCDASTAGQVAFLLRQVRGELRRECEALRALPGAACARGVDALLAQARAGITLVRGARVLVAGPPNSGKSTLVNRLAGVPRAIVSSIPGTTRDLLEARAVIDDVPVTFVDSCGLARAAGALEALGAERVRAEIARVDCVLCLGIDPAALPARPAAALVLGPKADLGGTFGEGVLPVSGTTGLGLGALRRHLLATLCGDGDWRRPAPFTQRQREALAAAARKLGNGDRAGCNEDLLRIGA